jgi:hypothetical protein
VIGWMSKTNTFDSGRPVSFAAVRTFVRRSGSLMKNFIFAVRIAWASS